MCRNRGLHTAAPAPRARSRVGAITRSMMNALCVPDDARAEFERDGYYVFRGILDASSLAPVKQLLEDKVEAMSAALAAVRVEAGAPARSTHAEAPFESRWARLAQEFADDCRAGLLPSENLGMISSGSWGRTDMLDERVHALITHKALLAVCELLLGPEVTANGDYYFRPAISDLIVDWGLEYHQDSYVRLCSRTGAPVLRATCG